LEDDTHVLPDTSRQRTVLLNSAQPTKFCSNKISTAKYSPILFLPKFLFEQFRRYANLFFLLIGALQQIPGVSPTGQYTTAIPLLMILCLSALKEIFEDIKRRRADDSTNKRNVLVLRDRDWANVQWRAVKVGDIVKVTDHQFFPADLVLLSSSEPQGMCYVETSNLDGETNLKIRQGAPQTADLVTSEDMLDLGGSLDCELPHAHLYEFVGTMRPTSRLAYPVGPDQLLLRGAMLRNTKWIFGLVVYTGHETKFMLNSIMVPLKRSTVEKWSTDRS
jgi:phospholipid-transporting ATPase